jgi:hypothetical protein
MCLLTRPLVKLHVAAAATDTDQAISDLHPHKT